MMADQAESNGLLPDASEGGASPEASASPAAGVSDNSLAPASSSAGSPAATPLSSSEALFDDLSMRKNLLDKILVGLTKLAGKADMVDQKDVTEEAGRLVAAGLQPKAMASLLANMPTQPEMLAKWIGGLRQMAEQRDVELSQQLKLARHNMMTHALGTLIKTPGMNQPFEASPEPQPTPSNPLMPTGASNASG